MSFSGFYYPLLSISGPSFVQTPTGDLREEYARYLERIRLFEEGRLDTLSTAQWDIASGEAYYLGSNEDYELVNSFTHDFWETSVDGDPIETDRTERDGTEISAPNSNWTSNLGDAIYDGEDRDIDTFFDTSDTEGDEPKVELTNTQTLVNIRNISLRLESAVLGENADGTGSGYGLDDGYWRTVGGKFHSGIDISGDSNVENNDQADEVYSPIDGQLVFVENDGDQDDRVLIWNEDQQVVWLLGHVRATDDIGRRWDNREENPAGLEISAGDHIAVLVDYPDLNDNTGNSVGDHVLSDVSAFGTDLRFS